VHATTHSLIHASGLLASKTSSTDAQLFLLKHLLILKQQIVAFDIEYVTPDVSFDFSGVTNTFYELRERGGLFDPRNLWRLVGGGLLPRVVENMFDAKVELDGQLRTVINDFTTSSAASITKAISESAVGKKGFDATAVVPFIQTAAQEEIPLLRRKLGEYLDDARTKDTLMGAVQDQVIQNYETFYERWAAEKRAAGKTIRGKGKGKEGELWDASIFAEWALDAFKAGRQGVHHDTRRASVTSESLDRSMEGSI
jgi:conserved oligomeric Golgi complex subunit 3